MKKIKKLAAQVIQTVRQTAADWAPDAMMVAGTGVVSYGAWLVYEPAGFIVGGVLLLVGGYFTRAGA